MNGTLQTTVPERGSAVVGIKTFVFHQQHKGVLGQNRTWLTALDEFTI